MNCINTICLYLKKYLTDEQFENIFYDYIEDFQNSLEEDMYLNVLSTNFSSKQEKISLETELYNYVLENYDSVYENINDAYVERIIDSNKEDIVVEILKNKYQKREEVDIDCSMINTRSELIDAIKHALQYPHFCGDNWDAIEDLIYDIVLPQKLILHNWREVEKKLPQDTAILKSILLLLHLLICIIRTNASSLLKGRAALNSVGVKRERNAFWRVLLGSLTFISETNSCLSEVRILERDNSRR